MLKKQKFKCERMKEMENEIKLFENVEFGSVRTILKDREVWFVAKDICECLEIVWFGSKTINGISDKHKGVGNFPTPGGNQELLVIDESGVYKLVLRSRKPEAEKFQDWICDEVLPTIRKTGSYSITKNIPQSFPEALRAYANEVEQRELAEKQRDEAIRTKAWIGSKREATAMQTAAAKTRECNKLKIELDKSKEYASIRAVEKMTKLRFAWRKLRNYCTAKELDMKKVSDPLYGKINTYPNEAWKKVYGINLEYLF